MKDWPASCVRSYSLAVLSALLIKPAVPVLRDSHLEATGVSMERQQADK